MCAHIVCSNKKCITFNRNTSATLIQWTNKKKNIQQKKSIQNRSSTEWEHRTAESKKINEKTKSKIGSKKTRNAHQKFVRRRSLSLSVCDKRIMVTNNRKEGYNDLWPANPTNSITDFLCSLGTPPRRNNRVWARLQINTTTAESVRGSNFASICEFQFSINIARWRKSGKGKTQRGQKFAQIAQQLKAKISKKKTRKEIFIHKKIRSLALRIAPSYSFPICGRWVGKTLIQEYLLHSVIVVRELWLRPNSIVERELIQEHVASSQMINLIVTPAKYLSRVQVCCIVVRCEQRR